MGTWGSGPFENDTTSDWVYDLEASTGTDVLARALSLGDGYVDSSEGAIALGAAEVVAAALGNPLKAYLPEEVAAWSAAHPEAGGLRDAALQALTRLESKGSELHELWDESDGLDEYLSTITACRTRLQRTP